MGQAQGDTGGWQLKPPSNTNAKDLFEPSVSGGGDVNPDSQR